MIATKSGELFDAPNDMSGEKLLDIIGNSYLYVRPVVTPEIVLNECSLPQQETSGSKNSEEGIHVHNYNNYYNLQHQPCCINCRRPPDYERPGQ